jgi:chitinase
MSTLDLQHFDIANLQEHVDWFNIMSYDIHGAWDIGNKWTGPFVNSHTNLTEIQDGLDLLWRNNIQPDKVVLGLAFYSRSFTLTNPSCSDPGCGVSSGGNPGKCSGTTGILLNPEIQEIIRRKGLQPKSYSKEAYKAVAWDNQWVSFDDDATWRIKANLARSQCISGVMVWAISQDDGNATNAKALTRAIGRPVKDMPEFDAQPFKSNLKPVDLCRWSNCDENCPNGFKEVPRDGTNLMMTDETVCYKGQGPSKFCCPANSEQPKCRWRGFKNSGACSPGCNSGEVEVGTLRKGCSSKHQSACCDENPAVFAYGSCKWFGSAGTCAGSGKHAACGADYPTFVFAASAGAGGEQICTQGAKSFCCKGKEPPLQFTQCDWYKKATHYAPAEFVCESSCPEGAVRLGVHKGDCKLGAEAYCCKGTPPPDLQPRDPGFGSIQVQEFKLLLEK